MTDDLRSSGGQAQVKIKTNFKGVGQECPTHTIRIQNLLLVDVLLGLQALGEGL